MLLWPDYWKSTVAPDFFTIAPEARSWEGARALLSLLSLLCRRTVCNRCRLA